MRPEKDLTYGCLQKAGPKLSMTTQHSTKLGRLLISAVIDRSVKFYKNGSGSCHLLVVRVVVAVRFRVSADAFVEGHRDFFGEGFSVVVRKTISRRLEGRKLEKKQP